MRGPHGRCYGVYSRQVSIRSVRASRLRNAGTDTCPRHPRDDGQELAPQLPKLLENRVDGDVSWEVPVLVDPLTGTDREAPEILDVCRERMLGEGWDLAICLTDLPVYRDGTRRSGRERQARCGRSLAACHGRDAAASEGAGPHPPARGRAVRENQGARYGRSSRSRYAAYGVARIVPEGGSIGRGHEAGRRRSLRRPGGAPGISGFGRDGTCQPPLEDASAFKGAAFAAFATEPTCWRSPRCGCLQTRWASGVFYS